MSTAPTLKIISTSLDATLGIAAKLGQNLHGGEVIELVSDLGGGKTSFVKGLAAGMGSQELVHSPSFTISNQYAAGDKTLYHFDFYRLTDPGIMRDELAELLNDQAAVLAIEWADSVQDVLPADTITIHLQTSGESQRLITITCPSKYEYITSNLQEKS